MNPARRASTVAARRVDGGHGIAEPDGHQLVGQCPATSARRRPSRPHRTSGRRGRRRAGSPRRARRSATPGRVPLAQCAAPGGGRPCRSRRRPASVSWTYAAELPCHNRFRHIAPPLRIGPTARQRCVKRTVQTVTGTARADRAGCAQVDGPGDAEAHRVERRGSRPRQACRTSPPRTTARNARLMPTPPRAPIAPAMPISAPASRRALSSAVGRVHSGLDLDQCLGAGRCPGSSCTSTRCRCRRTRTAR